MKWGVPDRLITTEKSIIKYLFIRSVCSCRVILSTKKWDWGISSLTNSCYFAEWIFFKTLPFFSAVVTNVTFHHQLQLTTPNNRFPVGLWNQRKPVTKRYITPRFRSVLFSSNSCYLQQLCVSALLL